MSELFATQRAKLVSLYKKAGQKFIASTKPYKSTRPLVFDIVDPIPVGAATIAHAVARAGQVLDFFAYGVEDAIPDGFGGQQVATEADTNLAKGKSTNGSEDFVIEGMSCSMMGYRIKYAAAPAGLADPDVLAAYAGTRLVSDPAALIAPPQVGSPFNLENHLMQAILSVLAIQFIWNKKRIEYVGTMDEVPEGGAKSFLRANGDPRIDNRYRIPEGYLWRRDGQPDSEFNIPATLAKPVVIPITLVPLGGQVAQVSTPTKIVIDLLMRLHGLSVDLPSEN